MTFSGNEVVTDHDDTSISEAFSALAKLEQDFAVVELDALRQSEYAKRELYATRSKLLQAIPSFWPTVLGAGPDEFQSILSENDGEILASITNVNVERYQIKSDTEGEPRSLRFTFEFDSELFEDKSVSKDFEFVANDDVQGGGGYVSKPVNFKWTKAGKKKGVNKMLDLTEQLYQAEMALGSKDKTQWAIDHKSREGLWQFEKLREAMEKEEEKAMDGEDVDSGRSFLDWFGYRGAVGLAVSDATPSKPENGDKATNGEEDEEGDDDFPDPTLDVEIFPAADDIATALAEDLWPNVMDYFMQAQEDDDDDDEEIDIDMAGSDGEDAPELVEFDGFDEDERPAKKARKA